MWNQWVPSGNFLIGNVSRTNAKADTAFIRINSPRTSSPWIYNGQYPNQTQKMRVVGSGPFKTGDEYCSSGAMSLNRCGGRNVGPSSFDTSNGYTGQVIETTGYTIVQKNGELMGAGGDSGGPVYNFATNTTVIARGMVEGGVPSTFKPCPSYIPAGIKCAAAINVIPVTRIEQQDRVYLTW